MANKGTVIIVSVIHWHMTWQSAHSIAAGLAQQGYQVYFVEPIPKRWPHLTEIKRVWGRLSGQAATSGLFRQEVWPGVTLISPRTLPDMGVVGTNLNRHYFIPRLARTLEEKGIKRPLTMIHYVPIPAAIQLQNLLQPDVSVYSCVNDWPNDPHIHRRWVEEELSEGVDMVWADSRKNIQRTAQFNDRVIPMPTAVNLSRFSAAQSDNPYPENGRPLCAYAGTIGVAIDVPLLQEISHHFPLRLIGPSRFPLGGFSDETQIVGPVPHYQLPALLKDVDVLLLPYKRSPYIDGVLPAKFYEYLATGKPIVSIGLVELDEFQNIISVCQTREEFIRAIKNAKNDTPALREARISKAREQSWECQSERMDKLIQRVLNEKAEKWKV